MASFFSDMSEHESRVQALKSNLDEKRRVAEKLKQEYKRRVKARLENTEKSLVNQLHVSTIGLWLVELFVPYLCGFWGRMIR